MSPINPNFKPGVGHLVTDRFDFQSHIDGTGFRQTAGTVDLSPTILIGSTVITDVQTAIAALAGSIIVPSVPDATSTNKGVIQLSVTSDLSGTGSSALNPRVSGLQGTPIGTLSPNTNDVLQWNGTNWTSAAIIPATSSALGTVKLAGDLAGIGSTALVPRVGSLQGFSVSNASPSTGQALVWNGSTWTPTGIPASPTGTGFATLTSGTYDAAATANIRYTGGKFQTDSSFSIQYKNAAITGDLAWSPTSTNKTLTLPDITDFLVARSSTDTITNKTIVAANNTITDTSTASGDLLVSNGTKFVRFGQGVNGSFLGVSGGVLGYYTPSNSTPTGTGFATITSGVYDSTASANIRYTGGKFQTDANIQFKNGANLGDLNWVPTAARTLVLPDTTDTLVAQGNTAVLSNKTISASLNTITDTSTAVGDLLRSNGTKFVRFARSITPLQILRTNSGGTDIEWATVTFPLTYVRISQIGAGQLNNVVTTDGSGNPAAIIRFTGDGAGTDITLSGLVAPPSGSDSTTIQRITLTVTSNSRMIISNQDINSTSTNRIICPHSQNVLLAAATGVNGVNADGYSCDVMWDSSSLRWRVIAGATLI